VAKALERAKLTIRDVNLVNVSNPDIPAALAAGSVEAALAGPPYSEQSIKSGAATMLATDLTPGLMTVAFVGSGKFIKERPKVARDFLHAYVQGVKYYIGRGLKDPEIGAILSKHTKVPADTIRATIPFYIDPGARPRVQDLAAFQDWFHSLGWVKEKVPMERVVDLSFLE
jgi:NitT/TauT family transport system substrate-binding protein